MNPISVIDNGYIHLQGAAITKCLRLAAYMAGLHLIVLEAGLSNVIMLNNLVLGGD